MEEKNKINMNPTFDEVIKLDQELRYLASYEVTGGRIVIPMSVEDLSEFNIKIANKFNYFKELIQSGECSFDFIKNTVLAKNGPYPRSKNEVDFIDTSCFEKFNKDNKPSDIMISNTDPLIKKLVQSIFPNGTIDKVNANDVDITKPENKLLPPSKENKKGKKKNNKKK